MLKKRLVLKIVLTNNNLKFIIFSLWSHKILYKISTRYKHLRTKKKLSTFTFFSMCRHLNRYLKPKRFKFLYVIFSGLRGARKPIFTFLNHKIMKKFIFFISDTTQNAHNGCRGKKLPRH